MAEPRKRVSRMDSNSTSRISVTVPTITKDAMDQFAEEMGVTLGYAAQHFIKIGMTAEAIALEGGEVIANYPDGNTVPLANKQGNFLYRQALIARSNER